METLLVLLMIGAGGIGAIAVMVEAVRRERRAEAERRETRAGPDAIAAALLTEIALAGGASREEAESLVAKVSGGRAPVGRRIDLGSCAEAFARVADEAARCALLDAAVQLAVSMAASVPPRQYGALQDLSFGLGFHADALARLRAKWRFEYADYARASRPREADRAGIFRRVAPAEQARLMAILGLSGRLERAGLISAYRRLAGANHPDRVHDRGQKERDEAARRFIEITEAYERLLPLTGERKQP
ncbi:MAG TPA: J domain-containing protein [Thermoanaerobaculia bacterium]